MRYQIVLCFIIFLVFSVSSNARIHRQNMVRIYLQSIGIGVFIGSIIGISNALVDMYTPWYTIPLVWMGAWVVRHEMTDMVISDLYNVHYGYKKPIIEWSAWMMSWLCYMQCVRYKYRSWFYYCI